MNVSRNEIYLSSCLFAAEISKRMVEFPVVILKMNYSLQYFSFFFPLILF
jgi:hypothetical protein